GGSGDGEPSAFPYVPRQVTGLESGVSQIAAGVDNSCALKDNGAVLCWGYNGGGEVGDGTTDGHLAPVPVQGLASPVHTILIGYNTCAIMESAQVVCWGDSTPGKLAGGADALNRFRPRLVQGLDEGVTALALGAHHACAITKTNVIKCWGDNRYGQLGD